jgi:hypothetical protein
MGRTSVSERANQAPTYTCSSLLWMPIAISLAVDGPSIPVSNRWLEGVEISKPRGSRDNSGFHSSKKYVSAANRRPRSILAPVTPRRTTPKPHAPHQET